MTVAVLVVLMLAGGALRAARAADPGGFLSADERAYSQLAVAVADRGDYADERLKHPFHWAPGTPVLFAAADMLLPGSEHAGPDELRVAPWAQAVVGTALIPMTFALAATLAGPVPGLVAGAAAALYPPYIRMTGDLVSEPLGALTLTIAMLALILAWRTPGLRRVALAGGALGVAVLARADLLVLPAVLAPALAWDARRQDRRWSPGLRRAAVYLGAAGLVVAPWSAFASLRTHHVVPVTDGGSSTLFVATYMPGHGTMYGFKSQMAGATRRLHPRASHLDDAQIPAEWALDTVARQDGDRSQSRESVMTEGVLSNLRRYALGEPLDFAAMTAGKLSRMWLGYDRGTHHQQRTWVLVLHLALVIASVGGLVLGLARGRDSRLAVLALTLATATAVNAFFVAEPRHNARLLPVLVAGGAAGLPLAARSRSSTPATREG